MPIILKTPLIFSMLYFCAGCHTSRLADELGIVKFDTGTNAGEQIGVVRAEHCGLRVWGFGTNADLTGALNSLKRNYPDLRYMTRVRIEGRFRQYVAVDRDCWMIRGLGYK